MDAAQFEREVLADAVDDETGLWEPLWELNSRLPRLPPEERELLASAALKALVVRGEIQLERANPAWPSATQSKIVLSTAEAIAAIDGRSWRTVPPLEDIWFVATPAGESTYFGPEGRQP